jgi:hypothetical protein
MSEASEPRTAILWRFPPEDFAAWQQLVGPDAADSLDDYERQLADAAAELTAQGCVVEFWLGSVAEMRAALRGKPNTPANRAAVIAARGEGLGRVLGLTVGAKYVAFGLVQRPELVKQSETPVVNGDVRAAIRAAISKMGQ